MGPNEEDQDLDEDRYEDEAFYHDDSYHGIDLDREDFCRGT